MSARTRFVATLALAVTLSGALALAGTARADGPGGDTPAGLERGERILKGLDEGIEALRLLGGHEEEVARLQKLRGHLELRLANARRGEPQKGEGQGGGIEAKGEGDEKRALSRRTEILRHALRALKEGDRHDAAELVERAIQTAELLLGDRNDAEAQAAYERTPKLENLSKLLAMAAELWEKYGHERKAGDVAALAKYYAHRAEQKAAAAKADDDEGDDDDDDEMEDEDEDGDRDADDDEDDGDDARRQAAAARHAAEVARARLLAATNEAQARELQAKHAALVKEAQARAAEAQDRVQAAHVEQARRANVEAQVTALRAQVAEMQKMLERIRAELEAAGK